MLLLKTLHHSGFFNIARSLLKQKRSLVFLLHGTYPQKYAGIPNELHYGMSVNELNELVDCIQEYKIPCISTSDMMEGKPGINFTIDDVYANTIEYGLPIFEKAQIPFTAFVTTQHIVQNNTCNILGYFKEHIDKHAALVDTDTAHKLYWGPSAQQLQTLANHPLVEMGCHTHTHPHLHQLTKAEVQHELNTSLDILRNITNQPIRYFSYPYGEYNEETVELVKQAGFEYAFALKPRFDAQSPFEIPRAGIYQTHPIYLSAKLSFLKKY
jgi:peptidoglycan/xylan/chitin deacetylase (PgdA/CDA1 family)